MAKWGPVCGCPGLLPDIMSMGGLSGGGLGEQCVPPQSLPLQPAAAPQGDRLNSRAVCCPDFGDFRILHKPVFLFSITFVSHMTHVFFVFYYLFLLCLLSTNPSA